VLNPLQLRRESADSGPEPPPELARIVALFTQEVLQLLQAVLSLFPPRDAVIRTLQALKLMEAATSADAGPYPALEVPALLIKPGLARAAASASSARHPPHHASSLSCLANRRVQGTEGPFRVPLLGKLHALLQGS
jgi:hypothetical protein